MKLDNRIMEVLTDVEYIMFADRRYTPMIAIRSFLGLARMLSQNDWPNTYHEQLDDVMACMASIADSYADFKGNLGENIQHICPDMVVLYAIGNRIHELRMEARQ